MPLQPPSPFHQHIALPERTALLLSILAPWPRRGRELLVIGCGAGHVLPPLWQSGFDLSACEASPALREQARHRAPQGVEIMIHCGIDTVNMNGDGFETLVKEGESVAAGTQLMRFDPAKIKAAGYSDQTMMIITNSAQYQIEVKESTDADITQPALTIRKDTNV